MLDDIATGNRTSAWKTGAEWWRYAVDLVNWYESTWEWVDATDLVYLMEMICDAR